MENKKPLIIDSFVFSEEIPILEIRLNELNDVVDYFVLVESSKHQSGKDKPFFFKENKHLFEKFLPKIIDIQLDSFDSVGTKNWSLEIWQRNNIIKGLQRIQREKEVIFHKSDYLLISDLDEIPESNSLIRAVNKKPDLISFNHRFISYYLNMVCNHRGWYGSVLSTFEALEAYRTPNYVRTIKDSMEHFPKVSGWHFSGVGGFEVNWHKWITRVEPENKKCLDLGKEKMKELWEKCVLEDGYFFYCDQPQRRDIKLEKLDFKQLPKYVQENKEKFQHLILK